MEDRIYRKCPNCGVWNDNNDYCTQCNHLLNYQTRLEEEDIARAEAYKNRMKDDVEIFLDSLKNSKRFFVRGIYYLFYSVWFILFSIVSFFLALIALLPG